jgi:hypothetical protein
MTQSSATQRGSEQADAQARTCLDRGGFRGLGCEPASGPSDPTQAE